MTNLNNIISLDIDSILKNIINKDNQYTIPIFIPHLGCKNECVFCNQRKISGKDSDVSIEKVKEEVDSRLKVLNNRKRVQIAFFGGSFTGLSIESQIKYLELANSYVLAGKVESIRISTRPDYISVEILNILKKYNVKTIELGVQSMDEEVLSISKRGHTSLDVIRAARLINLFDIELGFQIMVGLPKSTIDKEIYTINKLLKFKPKQLRIYPVYVLKESRLYDMYKNGEYKEIKFEDAVDRTSKIINECRKSKVQIIRIGLQSTEDITQNADGIIGPVSDNFGEYALAKLVLNNLESQIKELDLKNTSEVKIICNKRYISIVVGPKKVNKNYLEEKYNIKIKVVGENVNG